MSRLVRTALLTVTALLAWSGVAAGTASASTSGEYLGLNLQPLMKDTTIAESRWPSFLAQLPAGRMSIARLDVNWQFAEPQPPVAGVRSYTWGGQPGSPRTSIDFQVAQMAAQGIRASPTFTAPPRWVWGPTSRLPEDRFTDFADFVTAFSARYGPGGPFWAEHPELPALPPVDYEIWNEANSNNFWTQPQDPAAYARLLQVLYPRLKAQQPGAVVLASIGWENAGGYLDGLWAAGGGGSIDGIGYHPYAPTAMAIMELVSGLRAKLGALGRPTMPIMVTETGQPVTYSGPGQAHAYDGRVSDAARAATQSFAADTLARSDCGVGQFLVYAVTGSETEREIIGEGFMGSLRYADGSPNVTGAALQRASRRWADAVDAGTAVSKGRLALCSSAPTPLAALLPLDLSVARSGNGCVVGTTGYDGHPLEGATLVLVTPDGRRSQTSPDAFGRSEVCVPNGPAISSFEVWAEVPKAARSISFRCAIPGTGCVGVPSTTKTPLAAPACTVTLAANRPQRVRGQRASSVKARARLRCAAYRTTTVKRVKKKVRVKVRGRMVTRTRTVRTTVERRPTFQVSVKPKGRTKLRRVRTVTLSEGKRVSFTVRSRLAKGDQLVLSHKVTPKKDRLPAVKVRVTMKQSPSLRKRR